MATEDSPVGFSEKGRRKSLLGNSPRTVYSVAVGGGNAPIELRSWRGNGEKRRERRERREKREERREKRHSDSTRKENPVARLASKDRERCPDAPFGPFIAVYSALGSREETRKKKDGLENTKRFRFRDSARLSRTALALKDTRKLCRSEVFIFSSCFRIRRNRPQRHCLLYFDLFRGNWMIHMQSAKVAAKKHKKQNENGATDMVNPIY